MRKYIKEGGTILTSDEHIQMRKCKEVLRNSKVLRNIARKNFRKENYTEKIEDQTDTNNEVAVKRTSRKRKSLKKLYDSSDEEEYAVLFKNQIKSAKEKKNVTVMAVERIISK